MVFSGEDGIRTHAPVKTNGFQDRPVMTTSVPLHIPHIHLCFVRLADDLVILSFVLCFVNTFFKLFQTFLCFSSSIPFYKLQKWLFHWVSDQYFHFSFPICFQRYQCKKADKNNINLYIC